MTNITHFNVTVVPTEVGQRVRATCYGGAVRMWHLEGTDATVVRFTAKGNPVIRMNHSGRIGGVAEVTDTFGCFRIIDENNKLVWETQELPS